MTEEQAAHLALLNETIQVLREHPIPGEEAYCRVLAEALQGIALMLEELFG